jgi:ketosteroid isomerase-like protein
MKAFSFSIKIVFGVICLLSVLTSCATKYGAKSGPGAEQDLKAKALNSLQEADRLWCQSASEFEGFMSFLDEDVVWYFCNLPPLKGRDAVRSFYQKMYENNAITLSWTPERIDVSISGDLGYTHGTYKFISAGSLEKKQEYNGNYATIWRKQKDNSWKVVVEADY